MGSRRSYTFGDWAGRPLRRCPEGKRQAKDRRTAARDGRRRRLTSEGEAHADRSVAASRDHALAAIDLSHRASACSIREQSLVLRTPIDVEMLGGAGGEPPTLPCPREESDLQQVRLDDILKRA